MLVFRHKITNNFRNIGNVSVSFSGRLILNRVWGYASFADSEALNVQTSHLRRLLPATSVSIVNIKKRGYVLQVALARRTHHVPHQTFGLTRFSSPSIGELKRGASE